MSDDVPTIDKDKSLDQAIHFDSEEVFDFSVEPVAHPIDLFELSLPRPPQGTWRERFDVRVDVRFAHMELRFDDVVVRVSVRGARLSSACSGCTLLPHSLYGSHPLPSRDVVAVQEKQTHELAASGSLQAQARVGALHVIDGNVGFEAKASGETARRVEKQGSREESIPRIVPRPHGAWDLNEPHSPDGCLDGDYFTSRGQYLDAPSDHPADQPLATVQADEAVQEIAVELTIEIQSKDIVFHRILDAEGQRGRPWFKREKVNKEIIARRLVELASRADNPGRPGQLRFKMGTAALRGKRRTKYKAN